MPRSPCSLLAALLVIAALAGCQRSEDPGTPHAAPRCQGCNLVLVTFDSLSASHLGAWGYERKTSPEIDALARRSTVFLRSLSQSGSTMSSIPSLHTGKFPHADRLLDGGVLRPSEETLAEILRGAGYTTMAVIAHEYARCRWGACQGIEFADDEFVAPEHASRTRERVVGMLDEHLEEPFFLWVHFREPHAPYRPSREVFETLYRPRDAEPTFYSVEGGVFRRQRALLDHYGKQGGEPIAKYKSGNSFQRLTPTMLAQVVAMYDGGIREVDHEFGLLLDELESRGLDDRTVVVVTSDHGESMGGHGIVGHNELYLDVLHTPLIIHVPGQEPRTVEEPVMNVDVMPTALAVLGVEAPKRLRGVNVLAQPDPGRPQYAEYSGRRTLIEGGWKLLGEAGIPALYDVRRDPGETADRAASRPDVVRRLRKKVRAIRKESMASEPAAPDTDVLRKLKALGYTR